jgi:hypothetical protein
MLWCNGALEHATQVEPTRKDALTSLVTTLNRRHESATAACAHAVGKLLERERLKEEP